MTNSPYPLKQVTPATPISMAMELKNWLKSNIGRVQIAEELGGVTRSVFDSMVI